jgi:hypothetical protein
MKIQTWRRVIAIVTVGLFFVGAAQIGFSISINKTEPASQATETQTSFDPFVEGWTYRKQITIDHTKVVSDLTNFPVLIHITDSDLRTKAQPNGDDILFMNGVDIATQLSHEIEYYDNTSGELISWVNVTYLSSNENTIFYMYYGNPTSINQQNQEKVWFSSFKSVWHMNDETPSTIVDSTSNHYTGTKLSENEPMEKNGKVGKSQDFDGTNDYIQFTNPIIPTGTKTISTWFKCHNPNNWGVVLTSAVGISSFDSGTAWELMDSGNRMNCYMGNGATSGHFMRVFPTIPDTTSWHYYTMTYDGTTLRAYRDGVLADSTTTKSGSETNPTHNLRLGRSNSQSLPYPLDGELDEIRIADVSLSAAWIATEYINQNNPSDFIFVGPEEILSLKTTIIFGRIANLDTNGNFIMFTAVHLRCIQFSPFAITLYQSNEPIIISEQYHGLITPNLALAVCQAHLYPPS